MALFRCGAESGYKIDVIQDAGTGNIITIDLDGATPSEVIVVGTIGTGAGSDISNFTITNATLDASSTVGRTQWGTGWASYINFKLTNITGNPTITMPTSGTSLTACTVVAYWE